MEQIKNFFRENTVLCVVVLCVLCGFAGWLYADSHRNDGIYNNTDATVAGLEKRIADVEQRVDSVSKRLDQAEKTATDIGGRIESSTSLAQEIGSGIDRMQDRLDEAVQRSGRIENLIQEIEEGYRQRKTSPQETNLAK